MQDLIKEIMKDKIWQCGETETKNLAFRPEVTDACKANYCGRYNKSWMCPPGVGTLESNRDKIMEFSHAFVFTTKWPLEDSFDYEGMMAAQENHDEATWYLMDKLREARGETGWRALGAGSCTICKTCTYPDSPCRFPKKAIASIEACGIQVSELAGTLNINYINGENTVTYFSAVLYNK